MVRGPSTVFALRLISVMTSLVLLAPLSQTAGASTRGRLDWARGQLHRLEADISTARDKLDTVKREIRDQQARLHALQIQLNALAKRLSMAEAAYERTRDQVRSTHASLVIARSRYRSTRSRIDARARDLYERGPGSDLELIFGATSIANLTDRVEFVDVLEAQDSDLAIEIENLSIKLRAKQDQLEALRAEQAIQVAALRQQQAALDSRFSQQQNLLTGLDGKRSEESSLLSDLADRKARVGQLVERFRRKLAAEARAAAAAAQQVASSAVGSVRSFSGSGPFRTCPVQGPHAYSDDFGAPRYGGGYHPHAGNDIFAPRGTPIVAPFDGYASADPNGLGGNAVIVHGGEGYVYNAHLNSYGSLGSVSAGTVVGYVGNSGDAQGGATHDHFEWHPNSLPSPLWTSPYGYSDIDGAIDPYPFLNQVC